MKNALLIILWMFIFFTYSQNLIRIQPIDLVNSTNERLNFSQELYEKMMLYDVKHYHINLNVETTTPFISGNVSIVAQATSTITSFAFELHPNYLISLVSVKNVPYVGTSIVRNANEVQVNLAAPINAGELFEVVVHYSGNAPVDSSNPDAAFCQRTAPNGKKYTYTMSQPYGSADWMPVKQILSDKADSVKVYITTSANNRVGSQGLLKQVVNVGSGKLRYEWESKYPIAYYLISFAVGEYEDYTLSATCNGKNIPIVNYLYDNASITANLSNLNQAKLTLEKFCELFGEYPFSDEKYGHCQVPHTFYLENQTMSSMINFPNHIVAHELAHQWFGNALTLFSFSEIGLTEGLATYAEYLYRENFVSLSSARNTYNTWRNNVMTQPGGSVYLADSLNTTAMFDTRLIYYKGACLIHMIRYLINNDPLFFQVLNTFTSLYKHQSINYNLFADVIESVAGINIKQDFLSQWFRGEGFPTYKITWNWKNGQFHLISEQVTSKPSVTPFFKMPFELALTDANGYTAIIRFNQNSNFEKYKIPFATPVVNVSFDPRVFLLARSQITYNANLIVENDPPRIVQLNPAHLAEQVAIDSPLEVTFDEEIFMATGKIWIKNALNDSIFDEITVDNTTISGSKLHITPSRNFDAAQTYYVEMQSGIVRDKQMNFFSGISGKDIWKFTTFDPLKEVRNGQFFRLYPNPMNDIIQLQSDVKIKSFLLYTQLGQLVLEAEDVSVLDVRFLAKGVYIAKICLENEVTFVRKLVKY